MASRTQMGRQKDSCRLSAVLSSALLEWLLMLLLFLNALFSYLVTKFARFCKLQTPCLICSRLDHVLGNENKGFYKDLICDSHKSEISLLAYCHFHRKLTDAYEMCEVCLLSFATEKKVNSERYISVVGKLGVDLDNSVDGDGLLYKLHGEDAVEVPLLKKDLVSSSLVMNHCSCCSMPFRNKLDAVRLLQNRPIGVEVGEVGISLSNSIGHNHLRHQNGLSKQHVRSLGSTPKYHLGNHGFDDLSHIGYSEVKVTSDSESEVPSSSDDDAGNVMVHGAEDLKEDHEEQSLQPEPVAIIPNGFSSKFSDDTALEKLIHPASVILEPSLSGSERQLRQEGESHDVSTLASTVALGHSLEELNWNKVEARTNPPAPSETLYERLPSEIVNAKSTSKNCEVACISTSLSGDVSKDLSSIEVDPKNSQTAQKSTLSIPVHMDLNDAYRLAVGTKSSLTSPTVTELLTGRDSSKVQELKLLISQISAARGLDNPWGEMSPSPRVYGQGDELKFSDASNSPVLLNISKRLSIERNESGLESLDGSMISEIEGESAVDRLRRQIELDRKSLWLLYKELEEEKNASAIAANQAMAMITRLQEEKAAVQMEALQYQRMMEEQAEYDQEALQKSHELLVQREKVIQDLEAEVQSYRKQFGDGFLIGKGLEPSVDCKAAEDNLTSRSLDKKHGFCNKFEQNESRFLKDSLLGFEDEKAYISDCLKKLENKLLLFSNNGVCVDMSSLAREEYGHLDEPFEDDNGGNHEQINCQSSGAARGNGLEHFSWNDVFQENEELSLSKEDADTSFSAPGSHFASKEIHKEKPLHSSIDNDGKDFSAAGRGNSLTALENEISHLNERLKELEADRSFLEHTMNSLRSGDDGIRFVQEIACHLQELRRSMRSEHTVA